MRTTSGHCGYVQTAQLRQQRLLSKQQRFLMLWMCFFLLGPAVALSPELGDPSACTASGVPDVDQYRTFVPVPGGFLPIYSSFNMLKPASSVRRVLVMNTGLERDASTYFCQSYAAFRGQNSIGVIVPYFGSHQMSLTEWLGDTGTAPPQTLYSVYWPTDNWLEGGDGQPNNMSTFTALDITVGYIIKQFGSASIKNQLQLQRIVVAGFSAGGQLVNRYAWATNYGINAAWDRIIHLQKTDALPTHTQEPKHQPSLVTFVVSDPNTYLYFDYKRPASECSPLRDTGSSWSCNRFNVPDTVKSNCSNYNQYKLGLDGVGTYSSYFTRPSFDSSPAGLRARSYAYLRKIISYILGGEDVCNCNTSGYSNQAVCLAHPTNCTPSLYPKCCDTYPDSTTGNALGVECGDMLQGSNRLQRGLNYMGYLSQYGPKYRPVRASVVSGMGHNADMLYYSAAFKAAVYGSW